MHRVIATTAALAVASVVSAQQFQETTGTNFPSPNPTEYTNAVTTADIDGDGDYDLLFGNGGNFGSPGTPQRMRVYINDGKGVFTDETVERMGDFTGYVRGIALGDIEGDGDLDLILCEDFDRQPTLWTNDGTGVFTNETVGRIPAIEMSATRAQFGDLDNDGDLDVYINDGGNTNRFGCGQNRIWMNDGTGVFTDETDTRHPLGDTCEPMDVILGDLDNDFDLDVRTGSREPGNSINYMNDGTGVFVADPDATPGDSNTYSYDLGDMDGDGDLDMIGANSGPSNQELLLRNNLNGTFSNLSTRLNPNTNGDDNDSKFVDIDSDGDLDLIIAALFQSREKIYINNGGEFDLDPGRITSNNDATLDLIAADFDGDGDYDLVTGQGESGNYSNRYYTNTTGPADGRPPAIRVEQACNRPTDDIVIRAAITDGTTSDRGCNPQVMELKYSIDGGDEVVVPMTWSGHDIWRGVIPQPAVGAELSYRVRGLDHVGNQRQTQFIVVTIESPGPDLDGNCTVGFGDLTLLLASWGDCPGGGDPCPADLDENGTVDFIDLLTLLGSWG